MNRCFTTFLNMRKFFLLLISCLLIGYIDVQCNFSFANGEQDDIENAPHDSTKRKKKDPDGIRTGWTFGVLPSVSYDADLGFQYGALTNIYYFGDGSTYPEYLHSFYVEASYTTKRYGVFRLFYDSKYLIPKHRLTIDMSYLPDAMCDFTGFNGYQSVFNDNWRNSKKYSTEEGYKSRAFYKFRRDIFRVSADIQGHIYNKWNWNVGVGVLGYLTGPVNLGLINSGKKEENKLPDIDESYDKYVTWGLIKNNEKKGGVHPYARVGLTFDSRNQQTNPSKGIYSDAFLTYSAAFNSDYFGDQTEFNNLKFNFNFRHYVPIYKDFISFAYRLSAQLTVAGNCPFYMNSYWNTLYIQRVLYEGLGGGNTLRGIMRNRILSNGFAFANFEFRFKLCKFKIKKENFYIGLNPLFDVGMVLQPYDIDENRLIKSISENDPDFNIDELSNYFNFDKSVIYKPHFSAGIGLKIAMNDNFVLSVDWAVPFDKQDAPGLANFYVKIGYMF